jgi:hypothetical protein
LQAEILMWYGVSKQNQISHAHCQIEIDADVIISFVNLLTESIW